MPDNTRNISQSYTPEDFSTLSDAISRAETETEIYDILLDKFKKTVGVFELVLLFFDDNGLINFDLLSGGTERVIRVARKLEEDGVISWAALQKGTLIIPNVTAESDSEKSQLLLDTVYSADEKAFAIAVGLVDRDVNLIDVNDLFALSTLDVVTAYKLKNLLLENQLNSMGKQTIDLNQKLVESSMLATAGEIAGSVARELQSPIKIIDANLKLIETGIGSPLRRIEIIRNQLTLMQSLNKRFESIMPNSFNEKSDINICDTINEVLSITQSQLFESNIKADTDFEPHEFRLKASKSILEQIFLNLLMNAIDPMPEGGNLTFGVYKSTGNRVVINVADTGIGIPEENAGKIFEPYFTTKNESRKLGMGLYLTKLLVTKLRGKISFSSESGKGTTFRIILPLMKSSEKT